MGAPGRGSGSLGGHRGVLQGGIPAERGQTVCETGAEFIDIAVVVPPALGEALHVAAAAEGLRSVQVANVLGISALQIDLQGGYGGELFGVFRVCVRDVLRPEAGHIWTAHDFRWRYDAEPVAQLMRRVLAYIVLHELEEALFIDGRRAFEPHPQVPEGERRSG